MRSATLAEWEALPHGDVRTLAAVLMHVPPSVAHTLGNDERGSKRRPSWTAQHLANYFKKPEEAAKQAVEFAARHGFIEPAADRGQWRFREQERIGGEAWLWN